MSLLGLFENGDPQAPAIIVGSGGPTYTRSQIHAGALEFARFLRSKNVHTGDVVTIAESNKPQFIIAFLGITYARAVAAPLNQNFTKDEFEYYMQDAGSKLLVTGPSGNAAAEAAAEAASIPHLSLSFGDTTTTTTPLTITLPKEEANFKINPENDQIEKTAQNESDDPTPEDEALFLHTSGTTSRPKGVPLSHANLTASIKNITATYEFTPTDVSLLVMPLFHVHGLMAGLLAPLSAGAAVLLPSGGKFSAASFWIDAVAHKVTFYTAVPTIHQILIARAEKDYPKDAPPPLRVIRSCSSSLAPSTLHQLEQLFNAPVLEAYAMTEATHQMTSNPLPKHGAHKPGTVGKAQGSVQVAILGAGPDFAVLPTGEIGEVCIRGSNVTTGYKNNPAANEEGFAGGWFHTGDQGALDGDGYLKLTGRIKELINRGGEKISPLEVDATLLSHADVAEAVSFAAPDDKYGEVVAAVVVLTQEGKKKKEQGEDMEASIKWHCGQKLSSFKVPTQVFFTDELPKTATGKIQRRMMVGAFMGAGAGGAGDTQPSKPSISTTAAAGLELPADGFFLTATALAKLGVRFMFGVVGIPVTQLATAAQACGIRYIGCRNEQAAGYAAGAAGFLTGVPAVLLTVSGPGVVHGLAGLSNSQINCWPMIMISGSCETGEVGKGAFQELDQMTAVQPFVKLTRKAASLEDIPAALAAAYHTSLCGRPGATYVDLPSDILMSHPNPNQNGGPSLDSILSSHHEFEASPSHSSTAAAESAAVTAAMDLIRTAQRPLMVIGKGAALGRAETALQKIVNAWSIPFLATSMGRGVVSDDHPLCVNAARSMALGQADVAIIFGARLNWQLHFGESPKWAQDVKFILVDVEPSPRDEKLAAVVLQGDASTVAEQLLIASNVSLSSSSSSACAAWAESLCAKALSATMKLEEKLTESIAAAAAGGGPLNYSTTLRVIRDEIRAAQPQPIVVSEGANTMDNARLLLSPVLEPRMRLDAGTAGTMGVGPGYALAAAVACSAHTHSQRSVVAIEGDSAFGFSAMEVETACRYRLPILFIIFNNGGVYGGDRRGKHLQDLAVQGLMNKVGCGADDPAPTAFVPGAKYETLATAFGGVGVHVADVDQLQVAVKEALTSKKTTVINVEIDPMAGVESGNVHSFNAPKKN